MLTPRPGQFNPRKETRYPFYRRAGRPKAGLDGCGGSYPTENRSPDRPARNQSLYRLSYPVLLTYYEKKNVTETQSKYLSELLGSESEETPSTVVVNTDVILVQTSCNNENILIFKLQLNRLSSTRDPQIKHPSTDIMPLYCS